MFRILCDPSSASTELCLTEITGSDSQIFCVRSGRTVHTYHRLKITLLHTDQVRDKIPVNHYE
jgi:hypothetical protein